MKNLSDLMKFADSVTATEAKPTTKAAEPTTTKGAEQEPTKAAEQEQTKAAEQEQTKTKAPKVELTEEQKNELLASFEGLKSLGLTVYLKGDWIWIEGDTKPHKEAIKAVNLAGYKRNFSKSKSVWYFSPIGYRKKTRRTWDKEEIDKKFNPVKL